MNLTEATQRLDVLEQATGTAVRYATPEIARKARLNSRKLYMRARRTAEKAQNQQTEAHESMPGSEKWGIGGYAAATLEDAEDKFSEFLVAQSTRTPRTHHESGTLTRSGEFFES